VDGGRTPGEDRRTGWRWARAPPTGIGRVDDVPAGGGWDGRGAANVTKNADDGLGAFARTGHFAYESGDHGDTWLALDLLLADPRRLRGAAERLGSGCGPSRRRSSADR
jgi:hypothetical protein